MATSSVYTTGTVSIMATALTSVSVVGDPRRHPAGRLFPARQFDGARRGGERRHLDHARRKRPGVTLAGASYEIQRTPDDVRLLNAARSLLEALSNGNLAAIAALVSAVTKCRILRAPAQPRSPASQEAAVRLPGSPGRTEAARVYGASAAAARDILGTVAQSGGVPTGALFEYGSNADGEYVRTAGRIQICWNTLGSSSVAATTWTFPAAFAVAPVTVGAYVGAGDPHGATAAWVQYGNIGTNSVQFSVPRETGARVTVAARHAAIGRWY